MCQPASAGNRMVDRRHLKIAVQMDPIERIDIRGDSTFALLLEAQERRHDIAYYTPDRMALWDGEVFATVRPLRVRDRPGNARRLVGRFHALSPA